MNKKSIYIMLGCLCMTIACSDSFVQVEPKGVLQTKALQNKAGVNYLLVGAYAALDGWTTAGGAFRSYQASADNYVFGGITSGDAYKGTIAGDQPAQSFIEAYNILPDNIYFQGKWRVCYDGIARCNDALQALAAATDVTDAERLALQGEARFLRGHFHFELKKMFNMVPYIDETVYNPMDLQSTKVKNDRDIWPDINADFLFAYNNLPPTQSQKGRPSKWAAAAMLGKAYLFQKNYDSAKEYLELVKGSGLFALTPVYHDNFKTVTNNNIESIFEVQHSVNDGAPNGENGNIGATLNYPYGGGGVTTCCGFYQPSQNLVNAFKTDALGLPLIDTYNDADLPNDQGVQSSSVWSSTTAYKKDAFVTVFDPLKPNEERSYKAKADNTGVNPLTDGGASWELMWVEPSDVNVDPRLDWTVGRRGIPFLDWGIHPGQAYIRDQAYGGPYSPKKHLMYKTDVGVNTWSGNPRLNANNYRILRYSHVLLWLAEIAVQQNQLDVARGYVNELRARAANPAGFVRNPDGTQAANYVVNQYTTPWVDATFALKAVQFETRLEFGMEGHRFFDLVRWGNAAETINAYIAKEKVKRSYLADAVFVPGKHEYYPIPQQEILNSQLNGQYTLEQHPAYK